MKLSTAATVLASLCVAACGRPQSSATTTTTSPNPTQRSTLDVDGRAVERRAIEAAIWAVPAVNFERLFDGLTSAKGDWNQVVYWSRLPDWKNQTLTPNPDVIYLMPFYDTRNGPVVLEIPAAEGGSITGSVDDGWQTAIEDVGPAGVDKGKGGKYLILPPGYKEKPPAGFIPMPSQTYAGFALLRSNIGSGSDADIAKAVAYAKTIRFYPYAQAAQPPATRFIDAADVVYDSTIPYDVGFYERLDRFVQREPWIERDRAMIDVLRSIGIERGKPFTPDTKTQSVLKDAAAEARDWLKAGYQAAFEPPYFSGSRWAVPVSSDVLKGLGNGFTTPDSYPTGGRGITFTFGFFSAKHLGQGQFYLLTMKDQAGARLDGGRTYRLTVPPEVPVTLYWSVTAYDAETHALIREQRRSSRASTSAGLQKNSDGSVDVFVGPAAPNGKESNWVPTRAGASFELLFRLYGPQKPLFDKTWRLPDVERLPSS